MKNQTAVEWLMENLPSLFVDDSGHYAKLFEKAKEMERERLIQFYVKGCISTYGMDEPSSIFTDRMEAEDYFNQIYGGEQ
jgi:hypothetical protein